MQRLHRWLFMLGASLLVVSGVLLIPPLDQADAQCGADASSCKRCHQGEEAYPVNDLGQWHIDHADGDFCAVCHGGDKTTDDADAAHADMFDPLGDQARQRCTACHPADAERFADGYADTLASFTLTPAEQTLAAVPAATDDGYDWRNMVLAGAAGMLTMVSGMVVWNMEDLGTRFRRKKDKHDHA